MSGRDSPPPTGPDRRPTAEAETETETEPQPQARSRSDDPDETSPAADSASNGTDTAAPTDTSPASGPPRDPDRDRATDSTTTRSGATAPASESDVASSPAGPDGQHPTATVSDAGSTNHSRTHYLAMAIGVGAAAIVVGSVLGAAVGVATGVGAVLNDTPDAPLVIVIVTLVATQLCYGLIGAAYLIRRGGVRRLLGRPSPPTLSGALAATLALVVVALGVFALVPAVGGTEPGDPQVLVALLIVSGLVVGPAEEILFRGAVQGTLRRGFGPFGAIGLASLLFTVVHVDRVLTLGAAGLVPLAIIFLGSLAFGYAYERTETLLVPIAMHSTYDAVYFGALVVL